MNSDEPISREFCPNRSRKYLGAILVVALIVRLVAMVVLESWKFPSERALGYEAGEIGYALANGQGFAWPQTWRPVGPLDITRMQVPYDHPVPTSWEAPIYPFVIGAAFWTFGSYSVGAAIALELFQIILSLLVCCMLFCLGRQLFNTRVGIFASFICALYPSSIHFSVQKVNYAMLLTLLALVLIHQFVVLSGRPRLTRSFALGGLFGVASLVNPTILAFYPFALLWFIWRCQSPWLERLKYATAIVAASIIAISPWLIRNYLVFGRFVFIKPNFALELVRANFGDKLDLSTHQKQAAVTTDEGKMSDTYSGKALNLVLNDPLPFLRQTANRAWSYWFRMEAPTPRFRLVAKAAYYSLLCLGVIGIWTARRNRPAQLLFVFLLSMPLPFYVTWTVLARFRYPVENVLILFAACTLASWIWRNPDRTSLVSIGEKASFQSSFGEQATR